MADAKTRVARVSLLSGLVAGLSSGTFLLLELLGLRGAPRVVAYMLLTVGIVAGMLYGVAASVLDREA